jgi:ribosomal protein S12 methylthiotransferase
MARKTFQIVNLGCPKNLVDGQQLGRELTSRGLTALPENQPADVVVINTCGFIRAACEESLEAVLSAAQGLASRRESKRGGVGGECLLVVTGCLSGRYGDSLRAELPEVDLFFGPLAGDGAAREAAEAIAAAAGVAPGPADPVALMPSGPTAYVKIAEGCSNRCTYCTIPSIRGRRRSRKPEEVAQEVAALAAGGAREVVLVAQDTSAYGADLRPREDLAGLLERLIDAPGPDWLRLLYLHPQRVDGRLIRAMSAGGRLLPYFDIPVQHASAKVLRAMGRGYDAATLLRLVEGIRRGCPGAVLRTSIMVGFPGEGKRDFAELLGFIGEAAFDHLGCFIFSPEEGTPAASMRPRVSRRVAEERQAAVMELQMVISQARNEALVGATLPVLVEESQGATFSGRAARHAPEIDGRVEAEGTATPGEIVPVRITAASAYDLQGRLER